MRIRTCRASRQRQLRDRARQPGTSGSWWTTMRPVAGGVDVELDAVGIEHDRAAERGAGVFVFVSGRAAVGDDIGSRHGAKGSSRLTRPVQRPSARVWMSARHRRPSLPDRSRPWRPPTGTATSGRRPSSSAGTPRPSAVFCTAAGPPRATGRPGPGDLLPGLPALDSWRGEASMRSWLFTIGGNLLRDEFRKQKGRQMLSLEDRDLADRADPHEDLAAAEAEERVREGLARLPRLQREVFLLRAQEGIEYDGDRCGTRYHAGSGAGALPPRREAAEGAGPMTACTRLSDRMPEVALGRRAGPRMRQRHLGSLCRLPGRVGRSSPPRAGCGAPALARGAPGRSRGGPSSGFGRASRSRMRGRLGLVGRPGRGGDGGHRGLDREGRSAPAGGGRERLPPSSSGGGGPLRDAVAATPVRAGVAAPPAAGRPGARHARAGQPSGGSARFDPACAWTSRSPLAATMVRWATTAIVELERVLAGLEG